MKNLLLLLFPIISYSQTSEEILLEIKNQGICYPEIVLAQAKLETGNFECRDCSLDLNNLFGFRYKKKYICFDTWQESITYYKEWQDRWYKGQDYFQFLECPRKRTNGDCMVYGTDPLYIKKVKNNLK